MQICQNHSLRAHNTFGLDATCACFAEYDSLDELRQLVAAYQNNELPTPLFHIGAGSNLLFAGHFPGTLLHSGIRGIEVVEETPDWVVLRVGAAENFDDLVAETLRRGFYGLEHLSLIPGEVGAAAVQNIGAYGSEIEQYIDSVEGYQVNGKTYRYTHEQCGYGYRTSVFKTLLKERFFVTYVYMRLSRHFTPNLSYKALKTLVLEAGLDETSITADDIRRLVIHTRKEKLPMPETTGSAGSFFMNPVVKPEVFEALQQAYPDIPHYSVARGEKIPAAWLIEQTGWRGKSKGRAGVWPKQALVLVNLGGATGKEIIALSQAIQHDVYEKFGIMLQPEVNIL